MNSKKNTKINKQSDFRIWIEEFIDDSCDSNSQQMICYNYTDIDDYCDIKNLIDSQYKPKKHDKLKTNIQSLLISKKMGDDKKIIGAKFFSLSASLPDTIVTGLSIAITIGGLVAAPFTGGASIGLSILSMAFSISNNLSNETDQDRMDVYLAIGELGKINSLENNRKNKNKAALTLQEIGAAINNKNINTIQLLDYYKDNCFVQKIGNKYKPIFDGGSIMEGDELKYFNYLKKSYIKKLKSLNDKDWKYPNISQICDKCGKDADLVKQILEVLIEKDIIKRMAREKNQYYWYVY